MQTPHLAGEHDMDRVRLFNQDESLDESALARQVAVIMNDSKLPIVNISCSTPQDAAIQQESEDIVLPIDFHK